MTLEDLLAIVDATNGPITDMLEARLGVTLDAQRRRQVCTLLNSVAALSAAGRALWQGKAGEEPMLSRVVHLALQAIIDGVRTGTPWERDPDLIRDIERLLAAGDNALRDFGDG